MTSNDKVINYKVLDLVILYNFFYKVWLHSRWYKKVTNFFGIGPFVGESHAITRL